MEHLLQRWQPIGVPLGTKFQWMIREGGFHGLEMGYI
jgi:hypothetical protein